MAAISNPSIRIPITHITKEDNLQHVFCDGCDFSQYYSDIPMKELLRVKEAHYTEHLNIYYTDLRSRFRGTPDRYSFSRKKDKQPEVKPATSNLNRSNRANFTKSLSYIDYTIP